VRVGAAAATAGLAALVPAGSSAGTAVVSVDSVGTADRAVGADSVAGWWGTEAPGGRKDTRAPGPG
jgi:hypothetical protein